MATPAQDLLIAFGKLAHHYTLEDVIDAAGNLMMNGIRQKHIQLAAAQEQIDGMAEAMKANLRRDFYNRNGIRKQTIVLTPEMFPELAGKLN